MHDWTPSPPPSKQGHKYSKTEYHEPFEDPDNFGIGFGSGLIVGFALGALLIYFL